MLAGSLISIHFIEKKRENVENDGLFCSYEKLFCQFQNLQPISCTLTKLKHHFVNPFLYVP